MCAPDALSALLARDAIADAEAVIHLGACSSTTEPDAGYLLENNYRYSRMLCEWSLRRQVRFVYASSAATYGDGSHGYRDDEGALDALRPLNMYGYSKHMFDLWARNHRHLRVIAGLKYFNVYGPYEDHKDDMRSVVRKAYDQIRATGCVRLFRSCSPAYADGEQMRDFLYVRDAVDVMLYLLDHPGIGGLYNCGTGKARTWKDLVLATFRALGVAPRIEFIDMPEVLRANYQYFTEAPMHKLAAAGYTRAFMPLEEGIADYVANFLVPGLTS